MPLPDTKVLDPATKVPDPDKKVLDIKPDEFTEAAEWQAQTAGENKTNTRLFKHRKIDDLANYTLSLEDKYGKIPEDAVYLPGKDASDEEKASFNKAYGIPEGVESYKKIDTGLEPGVDFTEREFSSLAEAALKAEIKPEHVEAFQKWYADAAKERIAENNAVTKANTEKMTETYKEKWGEDYKVNYDAMQKATEFFGGSEFKDYLNKSGLGSFPKVVDFLVEKGLSLKDDTLLEGGSGGKPKGRSPYQTYKSMEHLENA